MLSNAFTSSMPGYLSTHSFPVAIYQFFPHSDFERMSSHFEDISALGFDAIQMPPIHSPGVDVFIDGNGKLKQGSCYAPVDHYSIAPYLYNSGISPRDYLLRGVRTSDSSEGWRSLAGLSGMARDAHLDVVADIVFGHTAGDRSVVARHEAMFGDKLYNRSNGGFQTTGVTMEDGTYNDWNDIAQFNWGGPARDLVRKHFSGVLENFLRSGVTVFRADDAPRIPTEVWADLIGGARLFAEHHDMPVPRFYAEAMCTKPDQDMGLIGAGFDRVTDSLRWWNHPGELWYIDRMNLTRRSGGNTISFASSHDTETFAHTFKDEQSRLNRIALTVFMSASFFMMEGTLAQEATQPSVFLVEHFGESPQVQKDFGLEGEKFRRLIKTTLALKKKYPIFSSDPKLSIETDKNRLTKLLMETGSEKAMIAFNKSGHDIKFAVPHEFRNGYIFGTNRGWFSGSDTAEYVPEYFLPNEGMAVFHASKI